MAYRFTLGTVQVECDSYPELLAAVGVVRRTVKTTIPGERAGRPELGRKVGKKEPSKVASVAKHGWALAKAYAADRGIPVNDARKKLSDPRVRRTAEQLLQKAEAK